MSFINPLEIATDIAKSAIQDRQADILSALSLNELYTPEDIASITEKLSEVTDSLNQFKTHTDRLSGASGAIDQPNLKTIAETMKAYRGQSQSCDLINNAFGSLIKGQTLLADAINKINQIQSLINNGPAYLSAFINDISTGFLSQITSDTNTFVEAQASILEQAFEAAIDSLVDDPCIGDIIKQVRVTI